MNIQEINENFHFPRYNLDKIDITNELNAAKKRIHSAQNSGQGSQECFLSFYPVAKNLRFVSSHFYNSVKNNRVPILSDRARIGEDSFWMEMTSKSWYPWLWIRYFDNVDSNEGNRKSWERLFNPIENVSEAPDIKCAKILTVLIRDLSFSILLDFLIYLDLMKFSKSTFFLPIKQNSQKALFVDYR